MDSVWAVLTVCVRSQIITGCATFLVKWVVDDYPDKGEDDGYA